MSYNRFISFHVRVTPVDCLVLENIASTYFGVSVNLLSQSMSCSFLADCVLFFDLTEMYKISFCGSLII